MRFRSIFSILVLLAVTHADAFFDPLSLGVIAAVGSGLGYIAYCKIFQCCDDNYINFNEYDLRQSFNKNVFGQHIAIDHVVTLIKGFYNNPRPTKALAMSLHGATGTGKNYISRLIVESLYKLGFKSAYVKLYVGRLDFSLESRVNEYKITLQSEIKKVVQSCDRAIFIFDEVEKMPVGLLDSLIPFLKHGHLIDGVSYSKAIFIFISNIGSTEINNTYLSLKEFGKERQEMTYKDFENILQSTSYNTEGGFKHSDLIYRHDLTWFIPVLPLEKSHVVECALVEFRQQGVMLHDKDKMISEVMADLSFYKDILSVSGCKKVSDRVSFIKAKMEANLIA